MQSDFTAGEWVFWRGNEVVKKVHKKFGRLEKSITFAPALMEMNDGRGVAKKKNKFFFQKHL